jgi:hypothetical protein
MVFIFIEWESFLLELTKKQQSHLVCFASSSISYYKSVNTVYIIILIINIFK